MMLATLDNRMYDLLAQMYLALPKEGKHYKNIG